jgi:hypothetical protein
MRLGLLTTLGTNIGDDFIREGLLGVIRDIRPQAPLLLEPVNKHVPHTVYPRTHLLRWIEPAIPRLPRGRITARRFADRLAAHGGSRFDRCDLVLQCGTPILWPRCSLNEWAKPIWHHVLARLAAEGRTILNLGGGSCYPWESPPASLEETIDADYGRLMLRTARLTTVRDTLARQLLGSVGNAPEFIPCPAFLAAQTVATPHPRPTRRVLVNYMATGAHFTWGQDVDADAWQRTMQTVIAALERDWEIVFVCHDHKEFALAARLWPTHPRVQPRTVAEYFALARDASLGIFNRLHAGVGVAGLGIPSVCIGTDTRLLMVKALDLPIFYVRDAGADALLAAFAHLAAHRDAESQRLLDLRREVFARYHERLSPFFAP